MTDITVEGDVTVGMTVPETVVLLDVPDYTVAKTAMINGKRVFVNPDTRVVIEIVE